MNVGNCTVLSEVSSSVGNPECTSEMFVYKILYCSFFGVKEKLFTKRDDIVYNLSGNFKYTFL